MLVLRQELFRKIKFLHFLHKIFTIFDNFFMCFIAPSTANFLKQITTLQKSNESRETMKNLNVHVRFKNPSYCLRCGRFQGIGMKNVDQCLDCEIMQYSLD